MSAKRARNSLKREEILARLKLTLDAARFGHSIRVERVAVALGKKWGVKENLISPAALLHDCSRRYDRQGLLTQAKKIGLKIDPIRKFEPKLFHAEVSADIAKREFGIKNQQILRAIRLHTVGSPAMSPLDKIIYLADHIEEGRDFGGVDEIRKLAFKDLDRAVVASTTNMIRFLLDQGLPVYAGTVATRNSFILKREK